MVDKTPIPLPSPATHRRGAAARNRPRGRPGLAERLPSWKLARVRVGARTRRRRRRPSTLGRESRTPTVASASIGAEPTAAKARGPGSGRRETEAPRVLRVLARASSRRDVAAARRIPAVTAAWGRRERAHARAGGGRRRRRRGRPRRRRTPAGRTRRPRATRTSC